MKKICSKCKEFREHAKCKRSKNGLGNWCKECRKEYDRIRHKTGKSYFTSFKYSEKIKRNREFVKNYFENHPCIDCGDTDWWALDFDHRNMEEKDHHITTAIRQQSLETLKQEIDKCDVRCVKCHRKRTMIQCNWWQLEFMS